MKNSKLIIFLLLTFSVLTFSQHRWIWQNPLPQGLPLHDVKIIDDFIFAVGVNATVLRSSDKGETWSYESFIGDETSPFSSLHFYDSQTGWTVTGDRILKTTDGGDSWVKTSTSTFEVYESIYFVDESTGWVAGSGGSVLKTIDGGVSWNPSNNGIQSSTRLYDVYFTNGSIGYAVGRGGSIYNTVNGGTNWNPQTSNVTFDLYSVFFLNNNNGWATGIGGTILHTTDGGVNWETQTSSTSIPLRSIYFLDDSIGFVSGFGEVLRTTNGGQIWNKILEIEEKWFTALSFNNTDGITVGSNGLIYQTDNSGENWQVKSSGETNSLSDIYLSENGELWVVGDFGTILKSEDGSTWSKVDSVPSTQPLNKITFADDNNGWAVGGYGAYIINTTNGGDSWNQQSPSSNWVLTSVDFANPDTGWCIGLQGSIQFTTNAGQDWIDQSLTTNPGLNDIHAFNASTAIIVGEDGLMLKTTNGGNTWDEINSSTTATLYDIFMLNDLVGWAVGQPEAIGGDGTIIMTTDGGSSWDHQTGGTSFKNFKSVKFVDSENGAITTSEGDVLKTDNGGVNWNLIEEPINIPLADVEMKDDENLWVVGQIGAIFKLESESTTDVNMSVESIPGSFTLYQNYPNPFNPNTKISWQSPIGSWQTLKVYDVLGKEVAVLADEFKQAGTYEITFDAGNLSSGIYFYQLHSGNFIETKKLVLMR